jgi:Holliday junction DNA helicase RuvA
MIRSLTGEISQVTDGYLVVVVAGVGYLVGSNTRTNNFKVGDLVTLYTHLAVRETALDLYGFTSISELDLFELLLLVPKIGPKSALQVLNQASPTLLIEAISKKDGAYLNKLSGIGKKTCENIVQFLHEKIEHIALGFDLQLNSPFSESETDAIDVLVSLGYELALAREIIKSIDNSSGSTNELVTKALKQIS